MHGKGHGHGRTSEPSTGATLGRVQLPRGVDHGVRAGAPRGAFLDPRGVRRRAASDGTPRRVVDDLRAAR